MGLIEDAAAFARERHDAVGQFRKYTMEPYWHHTRSVALQLEAAGASDEEVAAGHLHDTLEDTLTSYEELCWYFGRAVAFLVWEVSDVSRPEHGNRAVRKTMDRMHLAIASDRGQTIKLSDLIDNTASITEHDPHFAQTYMAEKALLLPYLKRGNAALWQQANEILQNWEADQVQQHLGRFIGAR